MIDQKNEAAIRARAYQLWVQSGYADGSQDAHWRQAEREIAEKAQKDEASAGSDGGASAASRARDEPERHVDGISPHPSVLDPGPRRSEG